MALGAPAAAADLLMSAVTACTDAVDGTEPMHRALATRGWKNVRPRTVSGFAETMARGDAMAGGDPASSLTIYRVGADRAEDRGDLAMVATEGDTRFALFADFAEPEPHRVTCRMAASGAVAMGWIGAAEIGERVVGFDRDGVRILGLERNGVTVIALWTPPNAPEVETVWIETRLPE